MKYALRLHFAATALVFAVLAAGCAVSLPESPAPVTSSNVDARPDNNCDPAGPLTVDRVPQCTPDVDTARNQLTQLKEAPAGALSGYVRDCGRGDACVFGRPWVDVDGDGCDQRSQVLTRDLNDVQHKPGRCAVTGGTLDDPYTATAISSTAKIQIDHVVPLAEMWRSGASQWTTEKRTQAANDLRNLIAVQGKANHSKSDKTPDKWLPETEGYQCQYARIYIGVKTAYDLTVTSLEKSALGRALSRCS